MVQPELPIEMPESDHFTVTLYKGPLGGQEIVRQFDTPSVEAALSMVESLRDNAEVRDNVTWDGTEVDQRGILHGLAPGADSATPYEITVVPPFPSED